MKSITQSCMLSTHSGNEIAEKIETIVERQLLPEMQGALGRSNQLHHLSIDKEAKL